LLWNSKLWHKKGSNDLNRWLLFDLAAAAVAGLLASTQWGYPWQLALLTGGSIGALTYVTRRTYFNLRQIHNSPPGWDDEDG
jgi:hypothetical protein